MTFHRSGAFRSNLNQSQTPKQGRATASRALAVFRPYVPQLGVILVAITVTSILGLINPLLLKAIIDVAIGQKDWTLLNVFVGLMIVVPIVTGLIGVGQTYVSNVVGQRVMRDLRLTLYQKLQNMPLQFFTATRTGEIQSRLSNDIGGIQAVVTNTAGSIVSNITTVVSTLIAMLIIDPGLTLLSVGLAPVFVFITHNVGKRRRELTAERQRSLADMSAMVEETLSVSGVLLTKTFGRQEDEVGRFGRENHRLLGLQIRIQMMGRWFNMAMGTIFSVTPALVYWVAGNDIINGTGNITIGDIVAFTTLQSRIFFPIGSLLNMHIEIQSALALFERIFEYLDLRQEIVDRPGARELDPRAAAGHVRFDEVSFSYPETPPAPTHDNGDAVSMPERAATDDRPGNAGANGRSPFRLERLSFDARPGQLIALVGPSGAGKTTTSYLIPRLYDVDEGRVLIDGHDVRDMTLRSLGELVGFVSQEPYLFHTSVRANLLYAKPDAGDEELIAAAKAAAIHDRVMELPNGYDTTVGERGFQLSGGEKQRLALARVILKDPRVLILDEATSSLDSRSEKLIQDALETVMRGRTTIAIAHRLSTILAADQILVFDRGRVVERGSHGELLQRGGLYATLYEQQFRGAKATEPLGRT